MIAKRIFTEFSNLFPDYAKDVLGYKEISKRNAIIINLMDGKDYEFEFFSKHDWCLKISGSKYSGADARKKNTPYNRS